MSEYNAYGELYDQRPELIIHDRLKNSGTIRDVIDLARQHNYKVSFDRGPFRHDMLIKQDGENTQRPQSHTINSGLRYFRKMGEGKY
jgi:hypothetical protein